MPKVVATYAVHACTTATVELEDVTDPDLVALYLTEDAAVGVSLCHECGCHVVDSEVGELTSFVVDGKRYAREYTATGHGDVPTGHWVRSYPACRTCDGYVCAVGAEDPCPGCCECVGHCIGETESSGDGESRG